MNICAWDTEIFHMVNGLAGKTGFFDFLGVFFASSLIFLMAAFVILLAGYRFVAVCIGRPRGDAARDIAIMLRAAAASLIAVGGNFLFSLLYFRERPYVALHDATRLIGEPLTSKSLPSDHASMAFAIAASVTFLHPRLGVAFLAAAAVVAVGRVFVGVHYPSDVLAGMFVGTLAAIAVRYIGSRLRDISFIEKELESLNAKRPKSE